ncbi:hypothetical protein [Nocardia sp. NPDC051463]|uniref:hypothetical protein n=1 Tax=Nocardia sp. NPDC051463 TaxID=3154845 RepID=UPI0034342F86
MRRRRGEKPEKIEPRQVEPIGPVCGAFGYCAAVGLMRTGPLFAVTGDSWADGLCPGIFTVPLGLGLAVSVVDWRRSAKRFEAAGVVGTAEIIAVDGMHISGEADEVAELTVRISGPGFDTFDADCERNTRDPAWEVGDRFAVVVDPIDMTYAIRS